ncbi:MAG: sulfite exporter TauE/SafE family protein [bacterium]
MSPEILSGFIIGLVGSLHCVGMCGPIAIALPRGYSSTWRLVLGRLTYNLGRVTTYALLGVVAGLLGRTLALAGFQRWLSITLGVAILLGVLLPLHLWRRHLPQGVAIGIVDAVRKRMGNLFQRRGAGSLYFIGVLNGLLPCGFVYVAMAAAAVTGTVVNAVIYMILFGLGTTPIMLATALVGNVIGMGVRRWMHRLIPVGALFLAALLILRGLSLGIPYVSPDLSPGHSTTEHPSCH